MSRESDMNRPEAQDGALYNLANDVLDQSDAYDYARCVWLGSAKVRARLTGQHPWPAREHEGETRVYSVPVHAGFSAVRGTALFIGKDPWHDVRDPRAWLVSEANLRTGEEWDYMVLDANVDAARHLRLQVAPAHWQNIPRWETGHAYQPARYDQIRFEGRLRDDYYLPSATLQEGLGNRTAFDDIEILESMRRVVAEVRGGREGFLAAEHIVSLETEARRQATTSQEIREILTY